MAKMAALGERLRELSMQREALSPAESCVFLNPGGLKAENDQQPIWTRTKLAYASTQTRLIRSWVFLSFH